MAVYAKAIRMDDRFPEELGETIARWAKEIFGNTPAGRLYQWEKGGAYRVVVYDGREPVSHLKIVERTGLIDGRPIRMGGVADVMTPPEYRGRGFAMLALNEAQRTMFEDLGAELGLLLCEERLLGFYARCGWQAVDCPVHFDQPSGKVLWPQRGMILARPGEQWGPRSIDLCGLPW